MTANDSSIVLWNYANEVEDNMKVLDEHEADITKFVVIDEKYIYTASKDRNIKKWQVSGKVKCKDTFEEHDGSVVELIVIDSNHIASGSKDRTVKVWDLAKGKSKTLEGHTRTVNKLIYIPEIKRLVSASLDETLRVWSIDSKTCLKVIQNGSRIETLLFFGLIVERPHEGYTPTH